MKNGLYFENDELVYYEHGQPYHAGVIKVDDAIYYISSHGRAVKGEHIVHGEMTNHILKKGTYTFGEDYKLIPGSYKAPKNRKRKKRKQPQKKLVISIVFVLSLFLALSLLFVEYFMHTPNTTPLSDTTKNTVANANISWPVFEEEVLLCSTTAKSAFDGEISLADATQTGDPYRPFVFNYELSIPAKLSISENENMENAIEYALDPIHKHISIDNLKTDTVYYYSIQTDTQAFSSSFKTAASTRFLFIPGLENVRDIGGYVNLDGKKVKQGLLIRGVEIDGLENPSYFIPEEDLQSVKDTFGFVYDMDLRSPVLYHGSYDSRLEIPHKFYDSPQYGGIFNAMYHESLREIFADLADPQKYPMYLHCTWGTDRTGTIIFLLQGILNLSEEDMIREYELTGYARSHVVNNGNLNVIISGLQDYSGDSLNDKIVTYLTTVVGVTHSEIESIRQIFLED